ncbi:MAG: diaminopimelate decarboxylase [Pirellulales bacterium]
MTTTDPIRRDTAIDHVSDLVARHFDRADGELLVGGLSVSDLAARHGTPLFIYDERTIGHQWQSLRHALPAEFDIYYSVKANPNQAILRYFVERGCGLEIASSGELRQALAAECPPEKIFFAGPGKTETELAEALDCQIGEIHVESLLEARRIAHLASRRQCAAQIALRVNPSGDVEGGGMRMGGRPTPFGIDEDQLDAVVEKIAGERWLDIVGVHLFVGTQILDVEVLLAQYRAALRIARRLAAKLNKPLKTIDFGGGLGVPYFAHEQCLDLERLQLGLTDFVRELRSDPALRAARLIVEPGRFLVAPAGLYIARVVDVKLSRGKKFVITDGGMHHHLAASGNLGQTIKRNFPVAIVNKLNRPRSETVDIVGPLCTPLDVLARAIELPSAEVGDLIGVFQSGAYARTASPLGFLSRQSPPEILVERGRDRVIRRRGTDDDCFADQLEIDCAPTAR